MDSYYAQLTTEKVNMQTRDIDMCSTQEMAVLMNEQDILVPLAVKKEIPQISKAVDILYESLKNGGRMFYFGAGTSGRLGVLDASECPPTFSTSPEMVQGYIAGGDTALRTAVEGCEDSREQGAQAVVDAGVKGGDVVVGITASGSAPYVLAAISKAAGIGAKTIGVATNRNTHLEKLCDVYIAPIVGPEVITGSTRMKSGTAQKMVLNMLTTCTMIKLGKVYGNLMVDLKPSNQKLYERAKRIICQITEVSEGKAADALRAADGSTKLAIMMLKTGLSAKEAQRLLEENDGMLRRAIQSAAAH